MNSIVRRIVLVKILLLFFGIYNTQAQQDTIRIGWVNYNEDYDTSQFSYLQRYLAEETKFPVKIFPTEAYDYQEVLDGFKANPPYDFAFLTPLTYVLAKKEYPSIVPFITYVKREDQDEYYRSSFVWIGSSTFDQKIIELLNQEGYLSLTNERSTSGYLWPIAYLTLERGIDLTQIATKKKGGHQEALNSLVSNINPAILAASWDIDIEEFRKKNPNIKINTFAVGGKIPNDPIVYQSGTKQETIDLIRNAFLSMHKSADGNSILSKFGFSKWVAQTDNSFERVRACSNFTFNTPHLFVRDFNSLPKKYQDELGKSKWLHLDASLGAQSANQLQYENGQFKLSLPSDNIKLINQLEQSDIGLIGEIQRSIPQIAFINERKIQSEKSQYRIEIGKDRDVEIGMAVLISSNESGDKIPGRIVNVFENYSILSIYQRKELDINLNDDKYFKTQIFKERGIPDSITINATALNPQILGRGGINIYFVLRIELATNDSTINNPEGTLVKVVNKDTIQHWLLGSGELEFDLNLLYKANKIKISLPGTEKTNEIAITLRIFALILEWVLIGGLLGGLLRFIGSFNDEFLHSSNRPWGRVLRYFTFYLIVGPIAGSVAYAFFLFLAYGGSLLVHYEISLFNQILPKLIFGIAGGLLGVQSLRALGKRILRVSSVADRQATTRASEPDGN